MARKTDPPVVLIKWYDFTKWLLDRVDSFPKNQRFIFGQRLADDALGIMELLVQATYNPHKADLLATANRKLEMLRWLLRLSSDRNLLSGKQYEFSSRGVTECGHMIGMPNFLRTHIVPGSITIFKSMNRRNAPSRQRLFGTASFIMRLSGSFNRCLSEDSLKARLPVDLARERMRPCDVRHNLPGDFHMLSSAMCKSTFPASTIAF